MARNEEKSQAVLNRWILRNTDAFDKPQKRPYLASTVDTVQECEKWRRQIIREIGEKVALIQNPSLGEHRLRDLNDEINKLMREKRHWERRTVELNGPDYSKASRVFDEDGKEALSLRGYKYFGAAKDLPGVKELFEERKQMDGQQRQQKSKRDIYKNIDATYYGHIYAEDDSELVSSENLAEEQARLEEADKYRALHNQRRNGSRTTSATVVAGDRIAAHASAMAEIKVPTQEDIERALLEKRKRELLQRL